MKAELRLRPHTGLSDARVIEVWYGGQFIATVTGADGPGVRVISKHLIVSHYDEGTGFLHVNTLEVAIDVPK
jgi:hypothetical protein